MSRHEWLGRWWSRDLADGDVLKKLEGRKIVSVEGKAGDEEVVLCTDDDVRFRIYHEQDCCETVRLHDVDGDLQDLVGHVVSRAEMVSSESEMNDENWREAPSRYAESWTWTFVKIQNMGASLTMRWFGESNGYYSEGVNIEATKGDE